jgi:hypothetical protein
MITSSGVYTCATCSQAYPWHITPNHLLYWNGQPYVPYGFWNLREVGGENLSVPLIIALTGQGINGFKVSLNFTDYNSLSKQEHINLINQETDFIIQRGGSYSLLVEDIITQTDQILTYLLINEQGQVIGSTTSHTLIPGENLPLMHRATIRNLYNDDFVTYKSSVAKAGLRSITLFNEPMGINLSFAGGDDQPGNFMIAAYPDLGPDSEAMLLYRQWLELQYDSIGDLNAALGTTYTTFSEVAWLLPNSSFATANKPAIELLQNRFWKYLMGASYKAIADLARNVFGDVPILVGGTDEVAYFPINPLQAAALEQGLDGLMISFYGNELSSEIPMLAVGDSRTGQETIATLQAETNRTLLYWTQEGNRVAPKSAEPGSELISGVNSCLQMRNFLVSLNEIGFTAFLINKEFIGQGAILASAEELTWFAHLQPFMLNQVVHQVEVPVTVCFDQTVWLPLLMKSEISDD